MIGRATPPGHPQYSSTLLFFFPEKGLRSLGFPHRFLRTLSLIIALSSFSRPFKDLRVGGPGGIRTHDLQLRRLPPYPGLATGPFFYHQLNYLEEKEREER